MTVSVKIDLFKDYFKIICKLGFRLMGLSNAMDATHARINEIDTASISSRSAVALLASVTSLAFVEFVE